MVENWSNVKCRWIMFKISGKRQNRVLCLRLPICLYIPAYKCDES